jgi:hypothetical protein
MASAGGVFRSRLDPRSTGAVTTGEGWAFGPSSVSGVEVAGAPGLLISFLATKATRRMFKTNKAPTRSRAERGHGRRAVLTRERAWLTLLLRVSGSSKILNAILLVVPSRQGKRVREILAALNFKQSVTTSYSR